MAFKLDWGWSRGFVETFSTTPNNLRIRDATLFVTRPFRRLWLWKLKGDIAGVRRIPPENKLTALDLIGNNLNVTQLKKLAKMKHLAHLRELRLMFNELRDAAVEVLCGEPFFQQFDLIRLGANPLTNDGRDQLRTHFGKRVSLAHDREPERLYAMQDGYFRVGWGNDYTQFLMDNEMEFLRVAIFDHAGNLLRTDRREVHYEAGSSYRKRDRDYKKACDKWLKELGHQSATIKVKQFQFANGDGLRPFYNGCAEIYEGQHQPSRVRHADELRCWLQEGQYSYRYGPDDIQQAWFNRAGELTDA